MTDGRLIHEVQTVLARAGYGSGSGLTVMAHGDGVRVGWHADALVRPAIAAHADDPEVAGFARMDGIRAVLGQALLSVFREAGFTATATADGEVLVTRAPRPVPGGTGRGQD
ncbi:hypothetical protein ACFFSH_35005 [Streptomyces filamentosus]|uniref:Uncharacterized protein n=1 Tax=Streptomyces filamentosus TaxID=67294 RepID=A0A919BD21_STRFL|nr:hypothetical protein [Streptomyces filamentosus]KAA6211426.1 hypothetical protein CP979_34015 [Streptomyces filamentosus]GHF79986.1 hypothetical protein GCM10017667_04400 [Streptomyces filamentosus]